MKGFKLRCYAYGNGDSWQAVCTDLDIAVEGASFEESREYLEPCISVPYGVFYRALISVCQKTRNHVARH